MSEPERVGAGVLAALTVWRLAVAACAFVGFAAAASWMSNPWLGLSQLASVLAGLVYLGLAGYPLITGGRWHEPRSPWLRGATAVLLMLVAITYFVVLEGDVDETWSLFEHLLTPLVVVVDWLLVGRAQAAVRWWHPLSWLVFPLAYTVYVNVADISIYRGMLSLADEDFGLVATGFAGTILALGYLLYGTGRLRGVLSDRADRPVADAAPTGSVA